MEKQTTRIEAFSGGIFVAFLSPFIALAITFGMWVFWAIATRDSASDFEDTIKSGL